MSRLGLMMFMFGCVDMRWMWLLVGNAVCRLPLEDRCFCGDKTDTGLIDLDRDGFSTADDCDDFDASVYPGSTEYRDGIDNNCNGEVDEGVSTLYYRDLGRRWVRR